MAHHPHPPWFTVGFADGTTRLFDPLTRISMTLPGHTWDVTQVAFDETGKHLFTASRDQTIRAYDLQSRRLLAILPHSDWVTGLVCHAGRLINSSLDGRVWLWSPLEGRLLAKLEADRAQLPQSHAA
ncbi:hypothetical protein KKF91_22105 [Myxococcota bacterium]|nr:hypothetical protein [Myxococcota bacterium]MBU1433236.1 hypothetical protein [Myxococcota bacterium]MBU1896635.1 hypothetical protein [Myxococcota bacterium]